MVFVVFASDGDYYESDKKIHGIYEHQEKALIEASFLQLDGLLYTIEEWDVNKEKIKDINWADFDYGQIDLTNDVHLAKIPEQYRTRATEYFDNKRRELEFNAETTRIFLEKDIITMGIQRDRLLDEYRQKESKVAAEKEVLDMKRMEREMTAEEHYRATNLVRDKSQELKREYLKRAQDLCEEYKCHYRPALFEYLFSW